MQWKQFEHEATWDMVDQILVTYPSLFSSWGKATWYGGLVFSYGGLVFAYGLLLWWFIICFMVVRYMRYDGLIYVIWCFDMSLDMMTSISLTNVLVYDLAYVLVSIFLMMLLYVHPCKDVNNVMSYVIKLHYAVWVSYYYAIMWLCYLDVMVS